MTNPLRKRFFGDTEVAQRYTGEAGDLLEAVHRQRGDLAVYQMHRVLGNGIELFAATRNGQDEIRIVAKPKAKPAGGKVREYCVWENDTEVFSDILSGHAIYGPAAYDEAFFYMGGALTASGAESHEVYTHGKAKYTTQNASGSGLSSLGVVALDTPFGTGVRAHGIYADHVSRDIYATTQTSIGVAAISTTLEGSWFSTISGGNFIEYAPNTGEIKSTRTIGTYFISQMKPDISGLCITRKTVGPASTSVLEAFTESAGTKTIALPPSVPQDTASVIIYTAMSKGGALWLVYADNPGNPIAGVKRPWRLYQGDIASGKWQEITVDGGFGSIEGRADRSVEGSSILMHDPITDAVCVIVADIGTYDLSVRGAWIFNGKDCFSKPMGAFYRKFQNVPAPVFGDPAFYKIAFTQFFGARIFTRYVHATDISRLGSADNIAGVYKVGRLLQKKQTNVE